MTAMLSKMKVTGFFTNITSDRPNDLYNFYRDVVALPAAPEYRRAVRAAGAVIVFSSHSGVRGGAREPLRQFTSLSVEDISAEQARIEAQGVSFIQRKGCDERGGIVSTFLDPDGNYVQLLQNNERVMA
ncbi:MAG: VOC family protein [Tepidiformaceae bacterium]